MPFARIDLIQGKPPSTAPPWLTSSTGALSMS
jgi:hypothetical protein